MEYLYSLTVALFLTLAIIPLLIKFSNKLRLIDAPVGGRKLHSEAMPRVGGLGIVLAASLTMLFLMPLHGKFTGLLPGCVIIVFFGLLDDLVELNYKWKIFGQSLAALVAMAGGVVLFELPFFGMEVSYPWISYPLTFIFLVGVVNGVNFSDGLDGLAGGTSIMALLLILILALEAGDTSSGLIAVTFIGAVLGFLHYNTYPAKTFMGDAGSQFLGFLIACLAIIVTQENTSAFSRFLPVLILGIPILDILQVIPVRVYKNLPLPGPDNEHFHHQILKLGFRHYEVVALVYLLQAALLLSAYFLRYYPDRYIALAYCSFVLSVCGLMLIANHFNWQFRYRYRQSNRVERRNRLLRRFGWLYRYLAKVVSAAILAFLFVSVLLIRDVGLTIGQLSLLLSLVLAVTSLLAKRYYEQLTRLSCTFASIFIGYLLAQAQLSVPQEYLVTGILGFLLFFLLLSIRMTRKDDFTLNTQDLLLLIVVISLPLLPFETLTTYSVSRVVLTAFLMLYAVEFLANVGRGSVKAVNVGSIAALGIIGVMGVT